MDKKCFYCSDEDDRMDTCTCGNRVCDKCMVGRGDSSAGRRHHHLVCEQKKEYETIIANLNKYIEHLQKK